MPALPLSEAFTARALGVFWNSYQKSLGLPPYLGTTLFPKKKTPLMDLKWFYGSSGLPVSLTPSNYDAQATLRDRIGFKQVETEMPFFRESYLVKEKDAAEYEKLMNSDEAFVQEILQRIMVGPTDLIQGANVVPERMIWQLLAPVDGAPKIAISANGVNYDYNYDPDGVYKSKNYVELTTATDKWTDYENSDPYEDLRMAQKAHRKEYGAQFQPLSDLRYCHLRIVLKQCDNRLLVSSLDIPGLFCLHLSCIQHGESSSLYFPFPSGCGPM